MTWIEADDGRLVNLDMISLIAIQKRTGSGNGGTVHSLVAFSLTGSVILTSGSEDAVRKDMLGLREVVDSQLWRLHEDISPLDRSSLDYPLEPSHFDPDLIAEREGDQ